MSAYREQRMQELLTYVERARRMRGWRLEVEPVPLGPSSPWDYAGRARELLARSSSVLDLGTGGGEFFAELLRDRQLYAVATEPWPPNVAVAAAHLRTVGAYVVHASSLVLPFRNESFDLVLNRHEELEPTEIARVLAPGGHVLTQQVHHANWRELRQFFPRMTDFGPHFERYQTGFRTAGLTVTRALLHEIPVAYRNIGEIVYMLTVAPWEIPGFNLEADLDALLALERSLSRPDGIVLTEGRYVIEAYKSDVAKAP